MIQSAVRQRSDTKRSAQTCESISCSVLRSGGLLPVTFLGVTRAHVMPTFARVARNNGIPKRDGYILSPRCDAGLEIRIRSVEPRAVN